MRTGVIFAATHVYDDVLNYKIEAASSVPQRQSSTKLSAEGGNFFFSLTKCA